MSFSELEMAFVFDQSRFIRNFFLPLNEQLVVEALILSFTEVTKERHLADLGTTEMEAELQPDRISIFLLEVIVGILQTDGGEHDVAVAEFAG